MYPVLEDVEKIRVLVGLNVDKFTMDIIDQAKAQQLTVKQNLFKDWEKLRKPSRKKYGYAQMVGTAISAVPISAGMG